MIPKIKSVKPKAGYKIEVLFYDGTKVLYDLKDDIKSLPRYDELKKVEGLYKSVQATISFYSPLICSKESPVHSEMVFKSMHFLIIFFAVSMDFFKAPSAIPLDRPSFKP